MSEKLERVIWEVKWKEDKKKEWYRKKDKKKRERKW